MFFSNGPGFWLIYFAPALIAWYRKKRGMKVVLTLGQIFLFNLLLGWTIVGWFLMLASAFGYNPIAWFVVRFGGAIASFGSAAAPMPSGVPGEGGSGAVCGQCGGARTVPCSTCQGRGSWYNPPSGESGVAQLQNCGACASSGRIRCPYCNGTGRAG